MYEVGEYLGQHPGGADQIEPYLGKCIDDPFEEAEHTKSARRIFQDLTKVGILDGGSDSTPSTKGANQPTGLDGFKLTSSLKIDYSKGIYH